MPPHRRPGRYGNYKKNTPGGGGPPRAGASARAAAGTAAAVAAAATEHQVDGLPPPLPPPPWPPGQPPPWPPGPLRGRLAVCIWESYGVYLGVRVPRPHPGGCSRPKFWGASTPTASRGVRAPKIWGACTPPRPGGHSHLKFGVRVPQPRPLLVLAPHILGRENARECCRGTRTSNLGCKYPLSSPHIQN